MQQTTRKIYKLVKTISQAVEDINIIFYYNDVLSLVDSMGRGTLNVIARSLDNVLQSCSMAGYKWCIETLSTVLILLLSTVLISLPHHMLILNHDKLNNAGQYNQTSFRKSSRTTSISRIDMQLCNRVLIKTAQGYRGRPSLEEVREQLIEKGYNVRQLDNNAIIVEVCRPLEHARLVREEKGLVHEIASTAASLIHGRISKYGKAALVLNSRNEQMFKVVEVTEK